ncbi:hypothetical protein ZWY2020_011856 [Hordeum vulgare]|nr:hypothetical protein ZWY2020_011856 [Hordeum vulgare]
MLNPTFDNGHRARFIENGVVITMIKFLHQNFSIAKDVEEEDVGDVGVPDLQVKQEAILDSLRAELAAEAKRRRLQEAEVEHTADVDKMPVAMDEEDEEEEEPEPSYAPIYPTLGTDNVDISDDEI